MSRDLGNTLVSTITKVAQQTQLMNANQLDAYGETEFAKLQSISGDGLEEKLQQAGKRVNILESQKQGLKDLLRHRGLGDNALVASLLIRQAERYWARRKG